MEESRGEAPTASVEGTESLVAKRQTESPAIGEQLMEEVCERENCKQALARVKANKGSAGVDGMTVQQLPEHLKQHWPAIREQLLSGTYEPQPVRRVEIPKPDGGCESLASRRCWIGLSSRRRCRYCKADGTGRFPTTATGFVLGGRLIRRWKRRGSTSPRDIAGAWTWIWRNSWIVFHTAPRLLKKWRLLILHFDS